MNRFFTLLLAASCLTAVGQVTYPYNPDGNADGDIAVGDLQDFLVTYGNPFSPSEIMVGDSSLTYWVEHISSVLDSLLASGDDAQPDPCEGMGTVNYFGDDYSLVPIGNQCWFGEELKTTRYNDGTLITREKSPQIRNTGPYSIDPEASDTCFYYYFSDFEDYFQCIFDTTLCGEFYACLQANIATTEICLENFQPIVSVDTFEFALGEPIFYYSYGVVQNEREVCPSGFHVPSWKNFTDLAVYTGPSVGGYHLKDDQFWDGDNSYGFGAQATGLVQNYLSSCLDEWNGVWSELAFNLDWILAECDSIPSDDCQNLITNLIEPLISFEEEFELNYLDVLTSDWIELNNASWDSALFVFEEQNKNDFLQACADNDWNAQIDWIDQGRYAEWWIRQPMSYNCEVQDAFMSVWGARTSLFPIQGTPRTERLAMWPNINCPIRCIKD